MRSAGNCRRALQARGDRKAHEFGTFNIRCRAKRQEREARDPGSAPPPAHRNVNFGPSRAMKEKVEKAQARSRPSACSRP